MADKRKAKRPLKQIFLQKRKQNNRQRAVQQESIFHYQKRQIAKNKDLFTEDTDTDTDTDTETIPFTDTDREDLFTEDTDTDADRDTEDTVTAKKAKPGRELETSSRGQTSAGTSQDA